jgi:hypothetical protein
MPYYKLYVLDENDLVTGRHEMPFANDEAAIAGAAREFRDQTVEIWEGARCILTFTSKGPQRQDGDLHRSVDILA